MRSARRPRRRRARPGFDIAATGGDGTSTRLLGSIDPTLKLLHLCGEDRRDLADARQDITPIVGLSRRALVETPDLRRAEGAVALIHSPRAGAPVCRAGRAIDRARSSIAAISGAAAEAAGDGWEAVEVAEKPSDDALLALAATAVQQRRARNEREHHRRAWAGARGC